MDTHAIKSLVYVFLQQYVTEYRCCSMSCVSLAFFCLGKGFVNLHWEECQGRAGIGLGR
jgi:hypothetical protein